MGWSKPEVDKLDDQWGQDHSPADICQAIRDANKGQPPERFRFSVKGEIWAIPNDVHKVRDIAKDLQSTHFWIPTRAWHDWRMSEVIEYEVMHLSNVHVLASVDPSDDVGEVQVVKDMGWSIMFTGDNDPAEQMMLVEGGLEGKFTKDMYRCPKTWKHKLGHCAHCTEGCFKDTRVEVHLKKHR